MLKKIVVLSLLMVGLSGQTFAKEIKIGFVNVVSLLGAAPQGETSGKMLEEEFRERETEMVALQKKIERAEKKYTVDAAILGESERSKRERAILVQKRDLKRLQSEFNEDLSLRKNEELRLLQKTVLEAIDMVAREGKYDLIVNEGVVFASKDIDISKLVLTELEVAHKKITAAAAEAATAKAKKNNTTMQLHTIATTIDALLEGDLKEDLTGVASLQDATKHEIGFVSDKKYLTHLSTTQAGAVILKHGSVSSYRGAILYVEDPYLAFAKVARLFFPDVMPDPVIHPSAVIGATAKIDPSAHIGALAVIGEEVVVSKGVFIGAGSVIGAGCNIGAASHLCANVSLLENTIVGARCILHSGCVIGDDGFGYANDHGRWLKIPQTGRVILGDDVDVGSNTTIDCGALGDTIIEDGVKLDNQIHIGHNVRIGAHTAVAAGVAMAGSATLGAHCTVAGMAGIEGHITIADNTHISAMCTVSKSIKEEGSVYAGAWPAQSRLPWGKMVAQVRRLPKLLARVKALEAKLKDK